MIILLELLATGIDIRDTKGIGLSGVDKQINAGSSIETEAMAMAGLRLAKHEKFSNDSGRN